MQGEEASVFRRCCSVADLEEPAETAGMELAETVEMALAETVEMAEAAVVDEFHQEDQAVDRIR